jgi:hypothetical protein
LFWFERPTFSGVQIIEFENTCQVDEDKYYEPCFFAISSREPETDDLPEAHPNREYGN